MNARARATLLVVAIAAIPVALLGVVYWGTREQVIPPSLALLYTLARQRRDIIETLTSPVEAQGWTERGIVLADGRTIPLPGIQRLPMTSDALKEATRQGVELGSEGRIYGLVRVWHWCGNDPVREHVVRVDIARLLIFLDQGDHVEAKSPPCSYPCESLGSRFREYGWDPSAYEMFKEWNEALDSTLRKRAT